MSLTLFHVLETVAAFAISIAILVYALGGNCTPASCKSMIFITSTFFSSRQLESNYGWPVATERSQIGEAVQYPSDRDAYAFSHYYECMYTSKMANKVCSQASSVLDYKACLANNTAASQALSECNALSSSNYVTHWPTAEDYTRCLFGHEVMRNTESIRASQNVFRMCLSKTLWPFFETQQTVDTPLLLGSFNWAILIAAALIVMTSFAVYTVSWFEEGHVKKGEPQLFMRFGIFWSTLSLLWCLVFFFIFVTVAFNHTTAFEHNEGVPTTASTMYVTLGLLGFCILYYGGEVFESQYWVYKSHPFKDSADAPDHYQKFKNRAHEAGKSFAKIFKHKEPHETPQATGPPEDAPLACLRMPLQPVHSAGFIKILDADAVAKYYTPPLMSTWADGYIADGCLFLGLAGATGHLTTDQSWNLFTLMTLYRLLNMMIARFMSESFTNNLCYDTHYNNAKFRIKNYSLPGVEDPSEPSTPRKDDPVKVLHDKNAISVEDIHLDIKVLGLSAQFAAVYVFSALCFIVFNGNIALSDYTLFTGFFVVGFAIPESIRFVTHVICQVRNPSANQVPWMLLNTHFFLWIWDLAARIIVTAMVILGTDSELEGSRQYLIKHTNSLMGDYLRQLGVTA